jgi:4a-hydroxytetrahydrobiopterin dehydratase
MERLAERECIPCRGDVPPLTREQLAPLVAQIDPAWEVRDVPDVRRGSVTMLKRDYRFKNFAEAMAFAVRVGGVAEEQQHHPDLQRHVGEGRCRHLDAQDRRAHRERRRLRRKVRCLVLRCEPARRV